MKLFQIIKFLPFYLLSLFPFFILHFFSDIFTLIFFNIFKYRNKVILYNLKRSFPEKDRKEIEQIKKRFNRHFSDIFIESVKILTISKASVQKRYHFLNPEITEKYYNERKSIIVYMGHYGNWEWFASLPVHIKHQMLAFYKRQSNSYFDHLMKVIRERFGNICIESKTGYKILSEYNKRNELVMTLMLGDQSPKGNSTKEWIPFLNRETAFLIGADRIAKKLGHILLFPKIRKIKRGFYEFEFIEIDPENTSEDLIKKYASCLEENIIKQPELWLWSHKRWKLRKEEQI